jgi:hypothetical protein
MPSFPVDLIADSPWQQLLHHIPFAQNVCVAGSVGTWFAHFALKGVLPLWTPSDIDVFVLTKSDSDFAQMVRSVAQNVFAVSKQSLLCVEAALTGSRKRIIDLQVEDNVTLSFIQVTFDVPEEDWVNFLMSSFDISVCKVALHRSNTAFQTETEAADEEVQVFAQQPTFNNQPDLGALGGEPTFELACQLACKARIAHFQYFIEMDNCVCSDIGSGQMEVAFLPKADLWKQYILGMRSLHRLEKYEARGFRLSKISFELKNMHVRQFAGFFDTQEYHKRKRLSLTSAPKE